jgi:hypothetical protein
MFGGYRDFNLSGDLKGIVRDLSFVLGPGLFGGGPAVVWRRINNHSIKNELYRSVLVFDHHNHLRPQMKASPEGPLPLQCRLRIGLSSSQTCSLGFAVRI